MTYYFHTFQRLLFVYFTVFFCAFTDANALDFKAGNYELIKGDESICEEGPLQIKDDQFSLGAKLIFLKFKTPTHSFLNDEKDCEYTIKNVHDLTHYEQHLLIKCQKAPLFTRSIKFQYTKEDQLLMTIILKNKTYPCELKLKK